MICLKGRKKQPVKKPELLLQKMIPHSFKRAARISGGAPAILKELRAKGTPFCRFLRPYRKSKYITYVSTCRAPDGNGGYL